ncbi:hypothetical protein ATCV1_z033R [Acanthocystis turfacea chlorella virus 1]|uniref:Uncharacterized protein z033R n=1 Tax=Chlorovirus heliozoae TaxID=322019 RepID=A7K7Z3_9PHYC|nr:hypothetical protein ATCV1_z033R [Acanthocystis turfacea chlorella virus 1]ABT16167.1 hypothetical protein ATCV1_z033R [Acanthocystis turfacea chlorella virus 1]
MYERQLARDMYNVQAPAFAENIIEDIFNDFFCCVFFPHYIRGRPARRDLDIQNAGSHPSDVDGCLVIREPHANNVHLVLSEGGI